MVGANHSAKSVEIDAGETGGVGMVDAVGGIRSLDFIQCNGKPPEHYKNGSKKKGFCFSCE